MSLIGFPQEIKLLGRYLREIGCVLRGIVERLPQVEGWCRPRQGGIQENQDAYKKLQEKHTHQVRVPIGTQTDM